MSVFIGVKDKDKDKETNGTTVHPARDYQKSAFDTFMSNPHIVKIDFSYPGNIIFNLQKFNTGGLTGDYRRFCVLVNEDNEQHILSDNKTLLEGFVGWKNRLTMGGGYKRKPVTKRKPKRKPVTKKKSTKKK
jgi:hypothetical protein